MPISLLLLVAHQFHLEKWGFLEESESEGWRKVRVSKHYKNICEYHNVNDIFNAVRSHSSYIGLHWTTIMETDLKLNLSEQQIILSEAENSVAYFVQYTEINVDNQICP